MYRLYKFIIDALSLILAALIFSTIVPLLALGLTEAAVAASTGMLFVVLSLGSKKVVSVLEKRLHDRIFQKGDTRLLAAFVDRLRFSFTTNELIKAFRDGLEYTIDATVYLIDMSKPYAIYNSPGIIGTDTTIYSEILRHYVSWKDGVFFFDDKLDLVSDHRKARGFFVVRGHLHLYCFMRFAKIMEPEVFPQLAQEFGNFIKRNETIEKMFAIAAVSKEWSMVAETQQSFLPKVMPQVRNLTLSPYFRPLVNVSGDYYDVLQLDENRTLLMLGDVSGKGLAAALVMGVVINTVRILEKKDDLVTLVRSVDAAIKGMRLQDKYTVLFIGIVDTKKMKIEYINASMADPLIISETRAGRQIRRLQSNCSLIGILELDTVEVAETKLFPGDVILIASDGVSEVPSPSGELLGDSERWIDFVTEESSKPVHEFVEGIASLVLEYAQGAPLRDDVTMLAAKVGE